MENSDFLPWEAKNVTVPVYSSANMLCYKKTQKFILNPNQGNL